MCRTFNCCIVYGDIDNTRRLRALFVFFHDFAEESIGISPTSRHTQIRYRVVISIKHTAELLVIVTDRSPFLIIEIYI